MEVTSAATPESQMPYNDKSEALSIAYIRAIAAKAGVNILKSESDKGVDLRFSKVTERNGHYRDISHICLPCQIKSTKNWIEKGDNILYDLEVINYNDLINSSYLLLVLMCLPQTIDQWLLQDEDCLRIHKCCYYWRPLRGQVETLNENTKRIIIPRTQIFTADLLTTTLNEIESRLRLC